MIDRIRDRVRAVSPRSWRNLLALVVPFAAGLLLVATFDAGEVVTPERIRAEVLAWGAAGLAAFLLASFVRPLFVVISGSLFAIAAGMVWGAWLGTALATCGNLLSSVLLVGLARALGSGAVRDLAGDRWPGLAAHARARGFAFVFVATLGYLLPTDLVVAVAATSGVRRRSVVAASALGSLPGTAAMATIGATFADPAAAPWWIGASAAAALTVSSLLLARRILGRRSPTVAQSEARSPAGA